ncbi:winged helix DNA-binding domain-containing protein [Streptomyces sp. NPDC015171]|uniref:winged helix DNA-binding domain-containing protein n=1 Tax=Streptomyces sp. NPDC015171 TaxID=3364945 RepID=UPI0036FA8040
MTKSSAKPSGVRPGGPRGDATATAPVLDVRALNRATLARQLLLRRSARSARDAVGHLLGLHAQRTSDPYHALAARLEGFVPQQLSGLLARREVARLVTLRSTLHAHTADDCLSLRPLVQPARDRELGIFREGLEGVDLDRLASVARELVEAEPRTMAQLRQALGAEWPAADPRALAVAARCTLPLVQVTPRGLWQESGQVALTTAEHWLGRPAGAAPSPDPLVLRYLAAFGPASVRDMQTWAGLTRLRPAFESLRPWLLTFRGPDGVELFDLPQAPRPDPATPAPPRFLPEYDNLLLSYADRSRVVPPAHRGRARRGNQAYATVLVDGFLAGLWRKDPDALVIEPFGELTKTQRTELAAEGERMLGVLHPGESYDIRFGDVVRP